jgi:Flp pilus assembly protein TadD
MEAALRIHPTWSEARRLVGVFLSMQGRWDEAIAAHQTSIRLDAQAPEPHYNLARAYEKKGLLSDARRAFERAAELARPRDRPELFLGIGDFLVRHGDLAEAERWFTKATQVFPDYVTAHSYLGYVYWKRGRFPEAKAAFERALRLDPDSVKAHEGLGLVLQAQGKGVEAQREFQHAQRGASSSRDRRHGQVSPAPVDRR